MTAPADGERKNGRRRDGGAGFRDWNAFECLNRHDAAFVYRGRDIDLDVAAAERGIAP
jgi:hypothetical protein